MSDKERIRNKIKEIKDLKEWVEEDRKLKENVVLIQIPYGMPGDTIMIGALISKDSLEQIKIYDEKLKEAMEKQNKTESKGENITDV